MNNKKSNKDEKKIKKNTMRFTFSDKSLSKVLPMDFTFNMISDSLSLSWPVILLSCLWLWAYCFEWNIASFFIYCLLDRPTISTTRNWYIFRRKSSLFLNSGPSQRCWCDFYCLAQNYFWYFLFNVSGRKQTLCILLQRNFCLSGRSSTE